MGREMARLWLGAVDHLQHPLSHRVRIPEQHARVSVPAHKAHLRHSQTHLEEAAERLVAKIVAMEVLQASRPPDALPGRPELIEWTLEDAPSVRTSAASTLSLSRQIGMALCQPEHLGAGPLH